MIYFIDFIDFDDLVCYWIECALGADVFLATEDAEIEAIITANPMP
jgi:hypothetical protein